MDEMTNVKKLTDLANKIHELYGSKKDEWDRLKNEWLVAEAKNPDPILMPEKLLSLPEKIIRLSCVHDALFERGEPIVESQNILDIDYSDPKQITAATFYAILLSEVEKLKSTKNETSIIYIGELEAFYYDVARYFNCTPDSQGEVEVCENTEDKPQPVPDDLITLAIVLQDFLISRTQAKRDIKEGKLNSYRKKPKGPHLVSRKEAGNLYLNK